MFAAEIIDSLKSSQAPCWQNDSGQSRMNTSRLDRLSATKQRDVPPPPGAWL